MRTFEVVLILVNLCSVIFSLKKQTRADWLKVGGVNLVVLLLHGVFEGVRYQMAFSYIFVILFVILASLKTTRGWLDARAPKALGVLAGAAAVILLVFTGFLAYALPVFSLPKPTGEYSVGIQYFHLIDEKRSDPFLAGSTRKRELMVKFYYPAQEDASKPFAPYFHSPELVRLFTEFHNLPGFSFDHLNLVKTNSKENLQIADRQEKYPLILFSHGAGTSMEVQTSQCEDLASHGYIVVAIDHPYVSVATIFPDRVVSQAEATTNFNVAEPAEIITQIMADDAAFVIDELGHMNAGQIQSIFKGKLDLEKIGAAGHSVGGAVAYNLAINDGRVKAAVNLDGVVYVTPGDNLKSVAPFLMLANDKFHIQSIENQAPLMKRFEDMDGIDQKITVEIYGSRQAYQAAYDRAQRNLAGLAKVLQTSGELFTIEGSDHMKFIDIGLFIGVPQLREQLDIAGKTDPLRVLEITKALTLAFFDQHLKGGSSGWLEALVQKYPELAKINLK